jgi:hypothetical protein
LLTPKPAFKPDRSVADSRHREQAKSLWAYRRNGAEIERKLNDELRACGLKPIPPHPDIDAKRNVLDINDEQRKRIEEAARHEAEHENRERDPYARRIPMRKDFIIGFNDWLALHRAKLDAEKREQRTHCFQCGTENAPETVKVNEKGEKGETVGNERLLPADEIYSGWDYACKVCGAVHRTVSPLEYDLYTHYLLMTDKEKQLAKTQAEKMRLTLQTTKEQDKVDDYVYRMNHPLECKTRVQASKEKNGDTYRQQNTEHNREKYRDQEWGPIIPVTGRTNIITNGPVTTEPWMYQADEQWGYTVAVPSPQ